MILLLKAGIPQWIWKRVTFYRLHLAYFITLSFIATLLLWVTPKKHGGRMDFIDCLYNAVSAICTVGLMSVPMGEFSVLDNLYLMIFMTMGCTIFTSIIPLYVRQYQSRLNIQKFEQQSFVDVQISDDYADEQDINSIPEITNLSRVSMILHKRFPNSPTDDAKQEDADEGSKNNRNWAFVGDGNSTQPGVENALESMYMEHEAMAALSWLVVTYFVISILVGFFFTELFFLFTPSARKVMARNGINHVFFAFFMTTSAFANSGISLLDDNMVSLRDYSTILVLFSILILLGNTMFAPSLRAIIWLLRKISKNRKRDVFDYLLQNPRKCFTHLFPRNQTIWLVVTVMGFNAFETIFFLALSWSSKGLKGLDPSQKFFNGIFQSITTRSAGMNVVSLTELSPSMLVLYIGMMYISVYPVFLSRQNTQAMIESHDDFKYMKSAAEQQEDTNISTQSRKLLARDSAYLFFSVFLICLIENRRISKDPLNFSVFNIIFEVISAYGNVGLSVGYSCSLVKTNAPCQDISSSFSGKWSVSGKLLMIVIMFLGRHRGLPDNIDSALRIPQGFWEHRQNSATRDDLKSDQQEEQPPDTTSQQPTEQHQRKFSFTMIPVELFLRERETPSHLIPLKLTFSSKVPKLVDEVPREEEKDSREEEEENQKQPPTTICETSD